KPGPHSFRLKRLTPMRRLQEERNAHSTTLLTHPTPPELLAYRQRAPPRNQLMRLPQNFRVITLEPCRILRSPPDTYAVAFKLSLTSNALPKNSRRGRQPFAI